MLAVINWVALIAAIATATSLLLNRNWRWSLGLLAFQYLVVFWMVQTHWPVSMAAAKVVAGWMACAVLGIAQLNVDRSEGTGIVWPRGQAFQIITAGMVLAVTFAGASMVTKWLGLDLPVAWGGLLLMGIGLLQLGVTSDAFRIILGLLTVLAGFDVLYTAVETSALVTALLIVVNLGLALAGAYFLTVATEERA